jgi:hypothetical protein
MTVTTRKTMKVKTPFLILPLALLLLAGLAFVACDQGSSPTPPMGITGTDELLFDDPQPGVTARVSPSTVTTPDPVTDRDAETTLIGMYRDPAGAPVEGLQMNFTADPVNPFIVFNPTAGFTDSNGAASTRVVVDRDLLSGSVILMAYTSPASAGPNARGQTTLWVNQGEVVETPGIPFGLTNPPDKCTLANCDPPLTSPVDTGPVTYVSTGPTFSSLGNTLTYRYDCGNGTITAPVPPQTSSACTFTAAGSYIVRAQATSSTAVQSDWSGGLTVTVSDIQ